LRICVFGHQQNHEVGQKITEDTVQKKNVPTGSFAYLHVCYRGKEITALDTTSQQTSWDFLAEKNIKFSLPPPLRKHRISKNSSVS
jgi:hypothetical protein